MHGSFLNVLNDVVSLGFEKKKKKGTKRYRFVLGQGSYIFFLFLCSHLKTLISLKSCTQSLSTPNDKHHTR